jgi:hypothetical protein
MLGPDGMLPSAPRSGGASAAYNGVKLTSPLPTSCMLCAFCLCASDQERGKSENVVSAVLQVSVRQENANHNHRNPFAGHTLE